MRSFCRIALSLILLRLPTSIRLLMLRLSGRGKESKRLQCYHLCRCPALMNPQKTPARTITLNWTNSLLSLTISILPIGKWIGCLGTRFLLIRALLLGKRQRWLWKLFIILLRISILLELRLHLIRQFVRAYSFLSLSLSLCSSYCSIVSIGRVYP